MQYALLLVTFQIVSNVLCGFGHPKYFVFKVEKVLWQFYHPVLLIQQFCHHAFTFACITDFLLHVLFFINKDLNGLLGLLEDVTALQTVFF